MNSIECETCIKRKTMYCPNSSKCYDTENKPFYQNRIMLLEENEQLKVNYKTIDEAMSKLLDENQQLKEINSLPKRELYKINKDRLDANLKLKNKMKELGLID